MKMCNIVFIFALSLTCNVFYAANQTVILHNEYKTPIVVNIDGQKVATLQQYQHYYLPIWPKDIKIKTESSPIYHSGIKKEVEKAVNFTKQYGQVYGIIKIKNDNRIKYIKSTWDQIWVPQDTKRMAATLELWILDEKYLIMGGIINIFE